MRNVTRTDVATTGELAPLCEMRAASTLFCAGWHMAIGAAGHSLLMTKSGPATLCDRPRSTTLSGELNRIGHFVEIHPR